LICKDCNLEIPEPTYETLTKGVDNAQASVFLRHWFDMNVDDPHDYGITTIMDPPDDYEPLDRCLGCREVIEDTAPEDYEGELCVCEESSPTSLAQEVKDMSVLDRSDIIYHMDEARNDCETCVYAYTEECPFIAQRVNQIWSVMGDMTITEYVQIEGGKEDLFNLIGDMGIETCAKWSLSRDPEQMEQPVESDEVLDMTDFSLDETTTKGD
jgi:hypothetical protein